MIELALPAGSLANAISALRAGADAVYFGMKDFSARKGAVNFSEEDLSKVRRYATDHGKKIYVTVNTLLSDSELEAANELLFRIARHRPDGVIVQDLGLARLVKLNHPTLPLHGSTQLAVHTADGVRELSDLGFERAVLSRELTLKEIGKIREACPGTELKVFVHGALCYGFSGLCMASANICGRSANRGECAQVCRTWFTEKASGRDGHFFSMEDLAAGKLILELDRMGIDSAKIEGRLKGPEYVASLARYYRSLLDSAHEDRALLADVMTTFSRKTGTGWFDYRKGRPGLLSGHPGHLGLECGRISAQTKTTITVETEKPVLNRDGLQYFLTSRRGLPEPVKFASEILSRSPNAVVLRHRAPSNLVGLPIYKVSSSTQNERRIDTESLPLDRAPVDVKVTLLPDRITAEAEGIGENIDVAISEARTPSSPKEAIERVFSQSGESAVSLGKLEIEDLTSLAHPYLPPSALKDLRRRLYARVTQAEDRRKCPPLPNPKPETKQTNLPPRELLRGDLPWSLEPKTIGGSTYITLPPVTFGEEELEEKVIEIAGGNPGIIIGLNNIAQVKFMKEKLPSTRCFADIYLYQANRLANELLLEELGDRFLGGYMWLERDSWDDPWPIRPQAARFTAPSFISRACFRHDALGESCSSCKGRHDYSISQNGVEYVVKVRDCLTVVEKLT